YMNREGFVHADMKPNNVVVAQGGEVKVIDFGQSCRIGTVKDRIQGTPDFIAPEQVHRRPLDARTDVYNFGATLYWTLTGRAVPSLLPNEDSVLPSSQPAVLPPDKLNEKIPPSLTKLILDCIEIHPARRPSSMNEVVSRLEMIEHTLLRNGHSKVLP
ncbi:MAG: protein kinase, partial [Planctomycetota bacterium]